jgi:hypothetical protein
MQTVNIRRLKTNPWTALRSAREDGMVVVMNRDHPKPCWSIWRSSICLILVRCGWPLPCPVPQQRDYRRVAGLDSGGASIAGAAAAGGVFHSSADYRGGASRHR